jgi:hypothetical protein
MSVALLTDRRRLQHAPSEHLDALDGLDEANRAVGEAAYGFLRAVARAEGTLRPSVEGGRDLPHLLSCRYGIGYRKAQRVVAAARRIEQLPRMVRALREGELSLEKFVELARFARPGEEEELLRWAGRVSLGAVRARADREVRADIKVDREAHRTRRLEWWFDDESRRFELFAELPAADGMAVARALEEGARKVPVLPGEEDPSYREARLADALVAMARSRLQGEGRATVVVHARWDALTRGRSGAELEGGPVIHPETARRLACTSKVEILFEDGRGTVLARALRRHPPGWMVRQIMYRDGGCVFPGCGSRASLVIHHLHPFGRGGPTTPENCCTLCWFHHLLVHELGWGLRRVDGGYHWTRPNGMPFQAGPSPPG